MCRELTFNRLGHHSWLVVPVRDLLENGHFASLFMDAYLDDDSVVWGGGDDAGGCDWQSGQRPQ